jgi:predicted neuraminidase
VAKNYTSEGPPQWDRTGIIFLKPDDFSKPLLDHALPLIAKAPRFQTEAGKAGIERYKERAANKLYQRLGWQPRCKPTVLPSGRILLPLYCDTFSISLMAVSDDGGSRWYASKPLIGIGAIQPTVLRRNDGTLVAYMRENGPQKRIRVCESSDDGINWGPVGNSELPNPGAGIDGVRLADGQWLLVYNDTTRSRNSLAVSISDDEGKTWKVTRHLEKHEKGSYHYPSVIQGKDGTIHAVYSYSPDDPQQPGQTMKHAAFNAAWVKAAK